MTTYQCTKCKEIKDISEFYKQSDRPSGHRSQCKACECIGRRDIYADNPYRAWARHTYHGHKKNGYKMLITLDELEYMAREQTHCPICDVELIWSYGDKDGRLVRGSPSLDRLNNDTYIDSSNSIIMCIKCNTRKNNQTFEDFVKFCSKVARKFPQYCE